MNGVHNGKKDHKCDSCGKYLSTTQYLKIHIKSVHNGQKDHKCNICGKLFSLSGALNTHNKTIHGQKYV